MYQRIVIVLCAGLICLTASQVCAGSLSFNESGLQIDAGSMGTFNLEYPSLETDSGDGAGKILSKAVNGESATIKYDLGAVLTMQIHGGEVAYHYQNVPDSVKKVHSIMYVPIGFSQGGKWKMDDVQRRRFRTKNPRNRTFTRTTPGALA